MEDLIKKYGGPVNLSRHMRLFYEKACEDKGCKHYFFGIKPQTLISDLVNYRLLVMQRPDHFYRDLPAQTSLPDIRVTQQVFNEIFKLLEKQLKDMGVQWREAARFAHHIVEIMDETRSQAADTVKSVIPLDHISLTTLDEALQKKGVQTRMLDSGELYVSRSYNLSYPFWISHQHAHNRISLTGRAYAHPGVREGDIENVRKAAQSRFPFMRFEVKDDESGRFIETVQFFIYTDAGIPVRMLLNLAKDFSWRIDEMMSLDKDEHLINVVTAAENRV